LTSPALADRCASHSQLSETVLELNILTVTAVILRPTVSRLLYPGVKSPSGTRAKFSLLFPGHLFPTLSGFFVKERSL
jgi:hypothetical protein